MLIIGHRGGGGSLPENTLTAIKAGISADIDILHIDVRMLRDNTLILLHDADLKRTHGIDGRLKDLDYPSLEKLCSSNCPPTLDSVLSKYLGKILLNIELRSDGSAAELVKLLRQYKNHQAVENTLISSFKISELSAARELDQNLNLALLLANNPFAFVPVERSLHLAAVGFHRLHTNRLAIEIAKKAGMFTFAYTANRSKSVAHLAELNLDGIATDQPKRIISELH